MMITQSHLQKFIIASGYSYTSITDGHCCFMILQMNLSDTIMLAIDQFSQYFSSKSIDPQTPDCSSDSMTVLNQTQSVQLAGQNIHLPGDPLKEK